MMLILTLFKSIFNDNKIFISKQSVAKDVNT